MESQCCQRIFTVQTFLYSSVLVHFTNIVYNKKLQYNEIYTFLNFAFFRNESIIFRQMNLHYIGCPTRYRNRHFFNNFTTGWRTAAPCRNNQTHYRPTLQTHSSSFLTQRTYSCSNFVVISSMPGSVASGTPYICNAYSCIFIYIYIALNCVGNCLCGASDQGEAASRLICCLLTQTIRRHFFTL